MPKPASSTLRPWERGGRAGDWDREETIIAMAACPTDRQRYHSRSPNVREVADLLGRTPGAVSLKFANIWNLHTQGTQGFAHVGAMTRQVFQEFQGRRRDLLLEAASIRLRLIEEDPTPRIELRVQLSIEDATRKLAGNRRSARRSGLDTRYVVTYAREGSVVEGWVFLIPVALSNSQAVLEFVDRCISLAGDVASLSRGIGLLRSGKLRTLARESIVRNAPGFHYSELSRRDEQTFAMALGNTGPIEDERPQNYLARRVTAMTDGRLRRLIRTVLRIDPSRLCRRCLLIAAHVAGAVQRQSRR
jgi:hypothetical protein